MNDGIEQRAWQALAKAAGWPDGTIIAASGGACITLRDAITAMSAWVPIEIVEHARDLSCGQFGDTAYECKQRLEETHAFLERALEGTTYPRPKISDYQRSVAP